MHNLFHSDQSWMSKTLWVGDKATKKMSFKSSNRLAEALAISLTHLYLIFGFSASTSSSASAQDVMRAASCVVVAPAENKNKQNYTVVCVLLTWDQRRETLKCFMSDSASMITHHIGLPFKLVNIDCNLVLIEPSRQDLFPLSSTQDASRCNLICAESTPCCLFSDQEDLVEVYHLVANAVITI